MTTRSPATLSERLARQYVVDAASGCWLWTGYTGQYGYGLIREGGKGSRQRPAHRVSYELYRDPIPDGFQLHHRCGTPACVNPAHLEPCSVLQHRQHHRPTHCWRGHDLLDSSNVYMPPGSDRRQCRTCLRIRDRAWRKRQVAA